MTPIRTLHLLLALAALALLGADVAASPGGKSSKSKSRLDRAFFMERTDVVSPRHLFVTDVVAGTTRQLDDRTSTELQQFAVDPTGRVLVAVYGTGAAEDSFGGYLYGVDVATGATTVYAAPKLSKSSAIRDLSMGPHGRYVLFTADHAVTGEHELYRLDLESGMVDRLSQPLSTCAAPFGVRLLGDISPDGRYAVYSIFGGVDGCVADGEPLVQRVFLVEIETGVVLPLPIRTGETLYDLAFDRRDTVVVYRETRPGPVVALSYFHPLSGTGGILHDASPNDGRTANRYAIDAKGRYAMFSLSLHAGATTLTSELFRADLASGEVTPIDAPTNAVREGPGFELDRRGRFAVYTADQDMFRVALKSGKAKRIPVPAGHLDNQRFFVLDPKRKRVVFADVPRFPGTWQMTLFSKKVKGKSQAMAVVDTTSTNTTLGEALLGPKGRALYFRGRTAETFGGLYPLQRADLKTGVITQLVETSGAPLAFEVDSTGRYLTYLDGFQMMRLDMQTSVAKPVSGDGIVVAFVYTRVR